MKKPTKTAGKEPMMGFRASPLRASIIRWAETHPKVPSLSEAVRLLVELGLAARSPTRPSGKTVQRAWQAGSWISLPTRLHLGKNKRAENIGCLGGRRNFKVCASTGERRDRSMRTDRARSISGFVVAIKSALPLANQSKPHTLHAFD